MVIRTMMIKWPGDRDIEYTPPLLLSKELEFEYLKSILTFSIAILGGAVTLKAAIAPDEPVTALFRYGIILAAFGALSALTSQQGVVEDLRLGRSPGRLRRQFRAFLPTLLMATGGMLVIRSLGIVINISSYF